MRNWSVLFLGLLISGCSLPVAQISTPTRSPEVLKAAPLVSSSLTPSTALPQVGEFTSSQLDAAGCGMTLWKSDRSVQDDRFLFFNGLQPDSMRMMLDGKWARFDRIQSSGQAFYGQTTSQIFRNQTGDVSVEVNVTLGAPGEIESVAIPSGTLRVIRAEQEVIIPIVGDAGC
jgi:hypothetical protein